MRPILDLHTRIDTFTPDIDTFTPDIGHPRPSWRAVVDLSNHLANSHAHKEEWGRPGVQLPILLTCTCMYKRRMTILQVIVKLCCLNLQCRGLDLSFFAILQDCFCPQRKLLLKVISNGFILAHKCKIQTRLYIEHSSYHTVVPYYESIDSICRDGTTTLISLK